MTSHGSPLLPTLDARAVRPNGEAGQAIDLPHGTGGDLLEGGFAGLRTPATLDELLAAEGLQREFPWSFDAALFGM